MASTSLPLLFFASLAVASPAGSPATATATSTDANSECATIFEPLMTSMPSLPGFFISWWEDNDPRTRGCLAQPPASLSSQFSSVYSDLDDRSASHSDSFSSIASKCPQYNFGGLGGNAKRAVPNPVIPAIPSEVSSWFNNGGSGSIPPEVASWLNNGGSGNIPPEVTSWFNGDSGGIPSQVSSLLSIGGSGGEFPNFASFATYTPCPVTTTTCLSVVATPTNGPVPAGFGHGNNGTTPGVSPTSGGTSPAGSLWAAAIAGTFGLLNFA